MEDALRGRALPRLPRIQAGVLILVLMEDALRAGDESDVLSVLEES